jgi:hypothetical protein
MAALSIEVPHLGVFALDWVVGLSPLYLPVILLITAWRVWVNYARAWRLSKRDQILLEFKIPREITKSPRAMELALMNLWQIGAETTVVARAWYGATRVFYSLEMASFGGEVHLYIGCPRNFKDLVERSFYAQYPEIELLEVDDYALRLPYDPVRYSYFFLEHTLVKPDVYPIKTYVEYELDKDPKEEHKIDPFAQVLSFLASVKSNEQVWLQIIFHAHDTTNGPLFKDPAHWANKVDEEINQIRLESVSPEDKKNKDIARFPNPTWSQKMRIQTLERNKSKNAFDVGMQALYLTDKTLPSGHSTSLYGLFMIFEPFKSRYLNNFKIGKGHAGFDWPWQDYKDIIHNRVTRRYLDMMRRRSFIHVPWNRDTFVLTTESLASIFHPPSSTIDVPGLHRSQSTKGTPPPNLPR